MKVRKVWVDADACPKVIKEVLYRAADRTGIPLTLVANQPLEVPGSRNIDTIQVGSGFDVADNYIVQQSQADDLVITADIPLAAEVIEKGGKSMPPQTHAYKSDEELNNLIEHVMSLRNN